MNVKKLHNGVTLATEAIINNVIFDEKMIHCILDDERIISIPLKWYPRLFHATDEQKRNWHLIGGGIGINWPDIDEDLSVQGFMVGYPSGKNH